MYLKKLSAKATRWYKQMAEDEGYVNRGQVSVTEFLEDTYAGKFTIIPTKELEALRAAAETWQQRASKRQAND